MSYSNFINQRDLNRIEDFSNVQSKMFSFEEFEKAMKKFPPVATVDILFCDDYTVILSSSRRSGKTKITQSGFSDIYNLDGIRIIKTDTITNISDDVKEIFTVIYLHILLNY